MRNFQCVYISIHTCGYCNLKRPCAGWAGVWDDARPRAACAHRTMMTFMMLMIMICGAGGVLSPSKVCRHLRSVAASMSYTKQQQQSQQQQQTDEQQLQLQPSRHITQQHSQQHPSTHHNHHHQNHRYNHAQPQLHASPPSPPPFALLQTALRHRLRAQVLHDVLARILWVPYCAICTGPVVQLTLTNSCLHQFCFDCLAQWTTIAPECPLCRSEYQTVLCDIRTADEYRELQIVDASSNSSCSSSGKNDDLKRKDV